MNLSELSSWYAPTSASDEECFVDPSTNQPMNPYEAPKLITSEHTLGKGIKYLQQEKPTIMIMHTNHRRAKDLGPLEDGVFEQKVGAAATYGFEALGASEARLERSRQAGTLACTASFDAYAKQYIERTESNSFNARVARAQATSGTPSFACDVLLDGTQLERDLLFASSDWEAARYPDNARGYAAFTNAREWVMVARAGLALNASSRNQDPDAPDLLLTVGHLHRDLTRKFLSQGAQVTRLVMGKETESYHLLGDAFGGGVLTAAHIRAMHTWTSQAKH